ncbi:unnamed protein product [Cyprideis torosa]|uniref:Uncharacterized protein n=1 Tax=Cyprideis torosa TaxID=163714 RepID=A0A7R8ZRU5_9CRUS|nr:unnamed protein product [Cyprideis torosa]CAG0894010.1 unnamed protein product [Cyprideis torosa]
MDADLFFEAYSRREREEAKRRRRERRNRVEFWGGTRPGNISEEHDVLCEENSNADVEEGRDVSDTEVEIVSEKNRSTDVDALRRVNNNKGTGNEEKRIQCSSDNQTARDKYAILNPGELREFLRNAGLLVEKKQPQRHPIQRNHKAIPRSQQRDRVVTSKVANLLVKDGPKYQNKKPGKMRLKWAKDMTPAWSFGESTKIPSSVETAAGEPDQEGCLGFCAKLSA